MSGEDNTMMYVGVVALLCCCSSSSGAAAFFLNKKKAAPKKGGRGRGRRGRGRRGRRRRFRCFSPETLVKLQNGDEVAMKDLKLGDVLVNGSVVKATMKIKNDNDPYYKLPGSVHVTGSHYIKDGDKYVQVKDFPGAELTTQTDPVVSCIVTDDHKIPVGDFIFWDWEDNLLQIPPI
jgi:hypothetical protein